MSEPKLHHYVPRVLLKRFASERKRGKFWTSVYDKSSERVFEAGVDKILAETTFNEIETPAGRVTIEPYTSTREAAFGPITERIIRERSLASLSLEELAELSVFGAMQYLRGTNIRNSSHEAFILLREKLIRRFGADRLPNELKAEPDEQEKKRFGIGFFLSSLGDISHHLSKKDLVLMEAEPGLEFNLGDNPVVLHNEMDFGPYGNIGFAVNGIEIYLPIDPKFVLAFWSPTVTTRLETNLAEAKKTFQNARAMMTLARPGLESNFWRPSAWRKR